jgi:hypothetical protein
MNKNINKEIKQFIKIHLYNLSIIIVEFEWRTTSNENDIHATNLMFMIEATRGYAKL